MLLAVILASNHKEPKMENQKVSVTLTVAEWNIVMSSLGKMPFEQVVSVVNQIKEQAEPQLAPPPVAQAAE